MKKIAFVPIDNRPICYSLPLDIVGQNEDIKLLLPKREFLGGLYNSSSIESLFSWLENLEKIDYLIYDDVQALEIVFGIKAKIVNGRQENIKVTNQVDLKIMEILLGEQNETNV